MIKLQIIADDNRGREEWELLDMLWTPVFEVEKM
jgi:hypothetical protein